MLNLTIQTDNAAFEDSCGAEVARILHALADRIADGATGGNLRDGNGNKVGSWELTPELTD